MSKEPPPRSRKDTLAREVDRLLRQLPGADPYLRSDESSKTGPPKAGGAIPRSSVMGQRAVPSPHAEPSLLAQHLGVWVRALLAAGLAVAVSYWPYARSCGWPLYAYLGVIGTVMIAGGWAATWAWRVRIAAAHAAALVVIFWGIVLSAEQILPRIGYAAESATWECAP